MNILPKTILVGTDFSEYSERALDHAIALAQVMGAKIVLLHVCPIAAFGFPEGLLATTRDLVEDMQAEARRAIDAAIGSRPRAGVPIDARVELGDARETLVSVAHELPADLIVVGTHGRRGVTRALLGSVAESVVRASPCPVLTIRGPVPATQAIERPGVVAPPAG